MEKPGLVDYLILPLKWLERSKGWKRRGLVLLYSLIFLAGSALSWRELHLWRLPNIVEPFDVAKYGTVTLAESDNARPLYEQAVALMHRPLPSVQSLYMRGYKFDAWATADPLLRQWVEENRPALATWLQATERPDFLLRQPNQMQISSNLDLIQSFREFNRMALTEGARRREAGDLEGAWVYYRGVIRSSRHAGRYGGLIQRLIGHVILTVAQPSIVQWTQHPAQTSALLRQAIRDIEVCQAMTPPKSTMIRVEYYVIRDALDHPSDWKRYGIDESNLETYWYMNLTGVSATRLFLLREPERSHRVNRLITAGLLAQIDRPRWARPKLFSEQYMLYENDDRTPWQLRSIGPEALSGWADHSAVRFLMPGYSSAIARLDFEPGIFDHWRLQMAERAYQIDHGQPAKTYADLIGSYLAELPEGMEPGDALSAPKPAP